MGCSITNHPVMVPQMALGNHQSAMISSDQAPAQPRRASPLGPHRSARAASSAGHRPTSADSLPCWKKLSKNVKSQEQPLCIKRLYVCIPIYIYIYIYIYNYMYNVYMYKDIYIYTQTYMYVYIYIYMYNMYIYIYTCIETCIYNNEI